MLDVVEIDKCLPQTQCGECGYPGCMPYAKAIAAGDSINKCPPGGLVTLRKLANLCNIDPKPYEVEIVELTRKPAVAIIREPECIGCTKCIQACPVDAIIGAAKHMHAIISNECTGCGLCVAPCPVDCIDMIPLEQPHYDVELARQHHYAKNTRIKIQAEIKIQKDLEQQNAMQDYLKKITASK
jgi:electron transport complex protein RnfB